MADLVNCQACGRQVAPGAECPGCATKAPEAAGLLSRKGPARTLWIIFEVLFVIAMIWAVIDKFG